MSNCTHPVGEPVLDCCAEVGDVPMFILVNLNHLGFEYRATTGADGMWEYGLFGQYEKTWEFNAAALAGGCIPGSLVRVMDISNGQITDTETPPVGEEGFVKLSEVAVGLPLPTLTEEFQDYDFSAWRMTTVTKWLYPNTTQMMIERCDALMAGRDFSGLYPWRVTQRNCKVVDWNGNESFTYVDEPTFWHNSLAGYQKSAKQFSYDLNFNYPLGKPYSYYIGTWRCQCTLGTYEKKSYENAVLNQLGTLISSSQVTYDQRTIIDDPAWPSVSQWVEMNRDLYAEWLASYVVLIPIAP